MALIISVQVKTQTSVVEMIDENLQISEGWRIFEEKVGIWGKPDFVQNELVDHINTTKDSTDYLWYTTRYTNNK